MRDPRSLPGGGYTRGQVYHGVGIPVYQYTHHRVLTSSDGYRSWWYVSYWDAFLPLSTTTVVYHVMKEIPDLFYWFGSGGKSMH